MLWCNICVGEIFRDKGKIGKNAKFTPTWKFQHLQYMHNTNTWKFQHLQYMHNTNTWKFQHLQYMYNTNIVAAFWGMHVSPAKHSYAWLPRKCDYQTDRHTHRRTDSQTPDKVIPMCRYTSQATQKPEVLRLPIYRTINYLIHQLTVLYHCLTKEVQNLVWQLYLGQHSLMQPPLRTFKVYSGHLFLHVKHPPSLTDTLQKIVLKIHWKVLYNLLL